MCCGKTRREPPEGQKKKHLRLWFSITTENDNVLFLFLLLVVVVFSRFSAHSVIFLRDWPKWHDFTTFFLMSRCNLAKSSVVLNYELTTRPLQILPVGFF